MASASSDGEILIDLRELLQGDEGKRSLKKEKAKNSFEVQLQDPTQIIEGIHFSDEYIGIKRIGFHCLLDCIDRAFCDHYQIRLSPDDFLLPLIQASAAVENIQAKGVPAAGTNEKIKLTVCRPDFSIGKSDNPWNEIFSEFRTKIAEHIGKSEHELYRGDFSTTGVLQQCAYDVALMDACQSRFAYHNDFMCGIPCVRLTGNVQDWKQFEERATLVVRKIGKHIGEKWEVAILEVIQKIGESGRKILSQNKMVDFWKSLYRWDTHSGGAGITGWINLFFPIVNGRIGKPEEIDGTGSWTRSRNVSTYSSSYCSVPVTCEDPKGLFDLKYYAGHVGTSQDSSLVLSPSWGWAVTRLKK